MRCNKLKADGRDQVQKLPAHKGMRRFAVESLEKFDDLYAVTQAQKEPEWPPEPPSIQNRTKHGE
jgi:hypothetical protein